MKKGLHLQTILTIVAVLIILAIAYSDRLDVALVLPVLGGFCLAYGIISLLKIRRNQQNGSPADGTLTRCLLQIILGGFIMMLGIIDLADISLPANFWNIVLVVIVVIALAWMFTRTRDAVKKN